MSPAKQSFLTSRAPKILIGCALAIIFGGILFKTVLPYLKAAIVLMYLGLAFQFYTDWKEGNRKKIQEVGFRFLIVLATVGAIAIITTLLKQ